MQAILFQYSAPWSGCPDACLKARLLWPPGMRLNPIAGAGRRSGVLAWRLTAP